MFSFFYDSLDTLKKVKRPTFSEVINLTLIIFVVVIISAMLFSLMDTVFGEAYQIFSDALS